MTKWEVDYKKLIQGLYESEHIPKNFFYRKKMPDFGYNVLNKLGLLYKPVIDLNYLRTGGIKPKWPDNKSFAVCLTHDVDFVSEYSFWQNLRKRRIQISQDFSIKGISKSFVEFGADLLKQISQLTHKDSFHCFELWLKAEKEIDAYSTFFFSPGISGISYLHENDCTYDLSDKIIFDNQKCSVAEMVQTIDQKGWEIGLHSSWYSYNNSDELKRQKAALEKVLDHEISSIRQHYLHYDIRKTPIAHSKAGFKFDSTLGFSNNIGFRFGTCCPWNLYDLQNEKELPIIEIPLIIQDNGLLDSITGLGLDEEMGFNYIVQIINEVENVGGVLTLLWHPNQIISSSWGNLYLKTLDYLSSKNAWFSTISSVGNWWEKNRITR